jgi:hypothetical protein
MTEQQQKGNVEWNPKAETFATNTTILSDQLKLLSTLSNSV